MTGHRVPFAQQDRYSGYSWSEPTPRLDLDTDLRFYDVFRRPGGTTIYEGLGDKTFFTPLSWQGSIVAGFEYQSQKMTYRPQFQWISPHNNTASTSNY
jgi:hypothetical protein